MSPHAGGFFLPHTRLIDGDISQTADAGVHSFVSGVTLKTVIAGTQTLTATDTANSTLSGAGVTVNPSTISSLALSNYPTPATEKSAFNTTVTASEAYGNVITGYTGTVHFMSSDGAATLPSDYSFTAGDSRIHVFGATLNSLGNQSLTVTDTVKRLWFASPAISL